MKAYFMLHCNLILLAASLFGSEVFAQEWSVSLTGDVKSPVAFTQKDFDSFPQSTVLVVDHNGKQDQYEGVSLYYLLGKGGVPRGDSLNGKNLLLYLRAEGSDGYKVVFALPEMDTLFSHRMILVADKKDGAALDAKEVPLHIIVPGEKEHPAG